jgi:hypothetical protein
LHPPRKALLHNLHHHGEVGVLRFANQQVKMLGHDYITDYHKLIPLPGLFQYLDKQVAPPRCSKQRTSPVKAASDEVEVAPCIVAFQTGWHAGRIDAVAEWAP